MKTITNSMNFELLETQRLLLKVISAENMKFIFEKKSKEEIKKILGHRSEEDFKKEEQKHKNGYSSYNRSFNLFLMIEKTSEKIIGRCGLHNWNREHRRAEIGYNMEDENYKKKGLMTETVQAVIDYGFNKMNLHRMEALVGRENVPSLKLMEKFQFKKEGVLREHYYRNDVFEDSVMFSRLHSEYFMEKKK